MCKWKSNSIAALGILLLTRTRPWIWKEVNRGFRIKSPYSKHPMHICVGWELFLQFDSALLCVITFSSSSEKESRTCWKPSKWQDERTISLSDYCSSTTPSLVCQNQINFCIYAATLNWEALLFLFNCEIEKLGNEIFKWAPKRLDTSWPTKQSNLCNFITWEIFFSECNQSISWNISNFALFVCSVWNLAFI